MNAKAYLWYKQAQYDLETAYFNYEGKRYSTAVFLIQQSIEKFLKATFIEVKKEEVSPSHSLIFFAKELDLPQKIKTHLKRLTPEFVSTRYPDVVNEIPYLLYDETITKEYLEQAEEIIECLEGMLVK